MEAIVAPVRQPEFKIDYEAQNITAAVSSLVNSVTYVDHLEGESDELEIELDDAADRWRNNWYPEPGARITLELGYVGEAPLPCGAFTVDEPEFRGPPDVVVIKGLAAGVNSDARTKRSVGYDAQTLREVADQVAKRHGFTVVGDLGPGLKHARITQNYETDLAFLARVARTWGYVFSVKGTQLVFHALTALDRGKSVLSVPRSLMKEYSLRPGVVGVYGAVTVSHRDPVSGKTFEHTAKAAGAKSGDTQVLKVRAESDAHAETIASAALRRAQGRAVEGTIKLEGDRRLVAGNNLELPDMGRLSGTYQIKTARHVHGRGSGWDVECEVSRVPG